MPPREIKIRYVYNVPYTMYCYLLKPGLLYLSSVYEKDGNALNMVSNETSSSFRP